MLINIQAEVTAEAEVIPAKAVTEQKDDNDE